MCIFSVETIAADDDLEKFYLEEIIVTAERKESGLQDVPIAITAFSGEDLFESGIENSQDLEIVTPGLTFSNTGTVGGPVIRGVGTSLQGPGSESATAVYVDSVYLPRFTSSVLDMLDVERVEVLKGPQGISYGRNVTGGAIKFITKEPDNKLSSKIGIQVGNYNLVRVKGTVNVPIVEDTLLFRGSVMKVKDDGYTENLLNSRDRQDQQDDLYGQFALKYLPTESLDIILRGNFADKGGSTNAYKSLHPDTNPAVQVFGATVIDDPRKVMTDKGPKEDPIESWGVSTTVNWDLQSARLTSITAYSELSFGPLAVDIDATDVGILHNGQSGKDNGLVQNSETFSQEFILASDNLERVEWLTGLYYMHDEVDWLVGADLPFVPVFLQFDSDNKVDAYAVFGDVTYKLTDQLQVNGGLRFSYEEKERIISNLADSVTVEGPQSDKESWDSWTPKVGVDYFVNDEVMVYLSVSRGFKSGSFNPTAFDSAVDPEAITSYEVGAKSTWLD